MPKSPYGAAVRDRQILRFGYDEQGAPSRRTEPHSIVARNSRWYLIAWDLDKDDWRVFRLDRMSPRVPTGPGFVPRALPAPDARTYLAARSKGSDAENRWPCVGQIDIELPLKDVALWIGDGELEELSAHSCRLTIGSWSWVGILAFAARFDAPFTVVGPDVLATASDALAARFQRAARG